MNAPTAPYLKTLVDCHAKQVEEGYKENFTVKEDQLYSHTTNKSYKAEEVKIVDFYRFEGQTDPADASIMYVMETIDGSKGTLVDGYGPSSDPDISRFILKVERMEKKVPF